MFTKEKPRSRSTAYRGRRLDAEALPDRRPPDGQSTSLPLRLHLANHSPTGAEWGCQGSGPAQTALAVLSDFTQDDSYPLAHYQDFKRDQVAFFPYWGWHISPEDLQRWIDLQDN